jgi:tRNA U55 pseudouridine synthase TruB
MTSHDVVAIARRQLRAAGVEKVGHCGTLDPLATGLLILTIGADEDPGSLDGRGQESMSAL